MKISKKILIAASAVFAISGLYAQDPAAPAQPEATVTAETSRELGFQEIETKVVETRYGKASIVKTTNADTGDVTINVAVSDIRPNSKAVDVLRSILTLSSAELPPMAASIARSIALDAERAAKQALGDEPAKEMTASVQLKESSHSFRVILAMNLNGFNYLGSGASATDDGGIGTSLPDNSLIISQIK